jgi:hypothetical protein
VQDKGTWRKRHNHELYNIFNVHGIIKRNMLGWTYYNFENSRKVKKMFNARSEGTRIIGRLRLRWEDGVIQNIRALRARTGRMWLCITDDWLRLLKSARAQLSRQRSRRTSKFIQPRWDLEGGIYNE